MFTTVHADFAAAQSDYRRAASIVEYRAGRAPSSRTAVAARLRSALRAAVRPVAAVPVEA